MEDKFRKLYTATSSSFHQLAILEAVSHRHCSSTRNIRMAQPPLQRRQVERSAAESGLFVDRLRSMGPSAGLSVAVLGCQSVANVGSNKPEPLFTLWTTTAGQGPGSVGSRE